MASKETTAVSQQSIQGLLNGNSNPFEKDIYRIDDTLNRIQKYKGVTAVLVVGYDGAVVRTNLDNVQSIQYANQFLQIARLARNAVRDLDPEVHTICKSLLES
jgi:hypothetical protein